MLIRDIDTNFEYSDERGKLVQLVRDGYKQINVISSKEGVVRGNHYHKINTEAFYVVSGALELTASKDGVTEKRCYKAGDFFGIDSYVVHSFHYLEDTVIVSMYSVGVELPNGKMDTYTE